MSYRIICGDFFYHAVNSYILVNT